MVPIGKPAIFKCRATGPVKWMYRGDLLIKDSIVLDDGHLLLFRRVELQHSGKYYCVNDNNLDVWRLQPAAMLVVLGMYLATKTLTDIE